MGKLQNTYLFRLYREDKLLFVLACLYIIGISYYALRQGEQFPFVEYGMYSAKEPARDIYTSYQIVVGGTEVRYMKLRDSQRELVNTTLSNAIAAIESGQMSKEKEEEFKKWMLTYCADMRMSGDSKMEVYRLSCKYNANGQPEVVKKELVYTYGSD